MVSERQIQEAVARCVATMVLFHNTPRTRHTAILMAAEIRAVAALIAELGLSAGQAKDRVVAPVEDELQGRYGFAEGRKLYAEFTHAFAEADEPIPGYRSTPV